MPDWSKLHVYAEQPWKSFEELCYQIAFRLYSSKGEITRVDDSGGGDGVEFYLTRPSGHETGWQAKFYYPDPRLDLGRKRHIKKSLERSLEKHRGLRKWILCTPTTFTPEEKKWFEGELQVAAGKVKLEHWHSSKIGTLLNEPRMAGIGLNFFGNLEFTIEWFRRQVEGQLRNVSDKYNPGLHSEGSADLMAQALLGDTLFVEELSRVQTKYREYQSAFTEEIAGARRQTCDPRLQSHHTLVLQKIGELDELLKRGATGLSSIYDWVQRGSMESIDANAIPSIIQDIRSATENFYETFEKLKEASDRLPLPSQGEAKEAKSRLESFLRSFSSPVSSYVDDSLDLLYGAGHLVKIYLSNVLHFLGNAGVGKTHLTCNLSDRRVKDGLPAVLLLGANFSPGITLKRKILEICDVPSSYSFDDFLSALDSYAFSRRTKVVIAIDGLNESSSPDVWTSSLGELEAVVGSRRRSVLLTTCRTSYVEPIWNGTWPKNSHSIAGFAPDKVAEAVSKYFDYYRIRATLTSASLSFFRNPLYVKIFCEGQNPERLEYVTVHIGEQSFLSTFDAYLAKVNQRISKKLSHAPFANVTQTRLLALARELWNSNSRSVSAERATEVLDNVPADKVKWDSSLTKALEAESLLIMRDWEHKSGSQRVSFAYDLLGGYLIASAAFAGASVEVAREQVRSQEFASRLLDEDFRTLHPMWDDILRCTAVLLPERFRLHLHSEVRGARPFGFGIRALFEMHPSSVREIDKRALESVFKIAENRRILLTLSGETALAPNHPLNWKYWGQLLKQLPTSERDTSWTEVVREDSESTLTVISNSEREFRSSAESIENTGGRLNLTAEYLSWFLVSTHSGVRDCATKALYWYGRRFPRELFALTLASFEINDLYVRERLVAAAYGVTMALYRSEATNAFGREILPEYAKALYGAIFASNAPHGTTHALIRDFAKHTLDVALLSNPDILSADDRQRLKPPYREGGIRRLHSGRDKNPDQYRDGNYPLGMDFHNYTLGRLLPNRRNYDFQDKEFIKVESHVWWRIYSLGYSLEKFGEIDKQIARRRFFHGSRFDNEGGVGRYGKKYAWIAFFELYGLFQDRGIIPFDWTESDDARPSDVDIEPSFPECPAPFRLIPESFLEPKELNARKWVQSGPTPNLQPYLMVETIRGKDGPWVLLRGSLSEQDEVCDHTIALHLTALILPRGEAARLVESKKKSVEPEYWIPRSPESHYAFVGEMPWCESIPDNGWTSLELLIGTRERLESDDEVRKRLAQPVIKVLFSGAGRPAWAPKSPSGSEPDRDRKPKPIVERIIEKFEVLVPTRYISWESYHTQTSEGQGSVLAKDVAQSLGLWVDLPSTDFRDTEGRLSTLTCDWGDSHYKNHGRFVYLRKDLLDRYLESNGLECAWGLWGERDYPYKHYQLYERNRGDRPSRVIFQGCWKYPL